jgi:hypothetical protein
MLVELTAFQGSVILACIARFRPQTHLKKRPWNRRDPFCRKGITVADIISFENKLQGVETQKADDSRRKKVFAVQRILQCSRCALKCEKCSTQIDTMPGTNSSGPKIPYRFCEECSEEYRDYIKKLQGGGDAACYWRNDAWMKTWRHWIDYQHAKDQYQRSREFRQLLEELKQNRWDE